MHNNIAKKRSKSLVTPTGKATDHMAFKLFPDTICGVYIYNNSLTFTHTHF